MQCVKGEPTMKKRIIRVLLLFSIIIAMMTGCSSGDEPNTEGSNDSQLTENTETSDSSELLEDTEVTDTSATQKEELVIEVGIPDEELSLMQKVLFNKVEYNEGQRIQDVEGIYNDEFGRSVTFQVVDLDHDGKDEVCITYLSGEVLIFHEIEGCIYGYGYKWRSMVPLYMDGTFQGSGGASYSEFYGNVSFTKDEFHREIITAVKYNDNGTVAYYKNGDYFSGEEISKEEYDQIMSQYEKSVVPEYDFTVENVLKYVK